MTKRILILAIVLVAAVSWAGLALAGDDETTPLAKMDGKELFRNVCKQCHGPDAAAGEYTPMTLIQEQWEEFFDTNLADTHKDVTCPKDKSKKMLDVLDKDMIKKIRAFCVDHAADSESPMTCG